MIYRCCPQRYYPKLLTVRPALYILMQKAAMLNTHRVVRKLLAELWINMNNNSQM
jgi:hypothetical protein